MRLEHVNESQLRTPLSLTNYDRAMHLSSRNTLNKYVRGEKA